MNHLHLCKLHDYVNYSNISIKEAVGPAGIWRKGRARQSCLWWWTLAGGESIKWERRSKRVCKVVETICCVDARKDMLQRTQNAFGTSKVTPVLQ